MTPHQVVLRYVGGEIGLACTCLSVRQPGRPGWMFIEMRKLFPAAEAVAAWTAWHEEQGKQAAA